MKKLIIAVLAVVALPFLGFSQVDSTRRYEDPLILSYDTTVAKPKIAIFAPLYLDSAFDANQEYRYARNEFPKFINPGLEFYEGAQLALDSLSSEGEELEVYVYDTRSSTETLSQQLAKEELADVDLLIAHCTGNEVRFFAEFARTKNIPFINTTLPNDAGIKNNPFFVILNPTLKTLCEGIYRYMQKYYSIDPIVVFQRKGRSDEFIKSLFDDYSKTTMSVPLKLKYVTLNDSFTVSDLQPYLSSSRQTLCLSGSLDINFGRRLAQQLAALAKSNYRVAVMGMPTWEAVSRDFSKPEYKGIEIIYSTPFYNAKTDTVSKGIVTFFNDEMYARPSDMVFRGYEVTWKFTKLLLQYGRDLSSNLGNKQYQVFTDFDIQPIINRNTMTLEYFENKKIYFLKWLDGTVKVAN